MISHWKRFAVIGIVAAGLTQAAAAQTTGEASTVFLLTAQETADSAVISIQAENSTGAGGLDLMLTFDPDRWQPEEESAVPGVQNMDVSCNPEEGTVRLLWDTTDQNADINGTLLEITLTKAESSARLSNIQLTVRDYYDNTVEMKDLPYRVEGFPDEPRYGIWIAIGVGGAIVLAGGAVFLCLHLRQKGKHVRKTAGQTGNGQHE